MNFMTPKAETIRRIRMWKGKRGADANMKRIVCLQIQKKKVAMIFGIWMTIGRPEALSLIIPSFPISKISFSILPRSRKAASETADGEFCKEAAVCEGPPPFLIYFSNQARRRPLSACRPPTLKCLPAAAPPLKEAGVTASLKACQ